MTKIEELTKKICDVEKVVDELKSEVKNLVKKGIDTIFNPDAVEWVDLGLPSGRLWAKENAPGFYNWDEANKQFGRFLPSGTAMAELYEECDWEWDGSKKGYLVTGPNDNSIFLPAAGYKDTDGDVSCVGTVGEYWTSCPSKTSQTSARYLYFGSGGVDPLDGGRRAYGFSVRPSREL